MPCKYQVIECNANGEIIPNGAWYGYATMDEFKHGLKVLAKKGWRFGGLHPWHMTPIDTVYVYQ